MAEEIKKEVCIDRIDIEICMLQRHFDKKKENVMYIAGLGLDIKCEEKLLDSKILEFVSKKIHNIQSWKIKLRSKQIYDRKKIKYILTLFNEDDSEKRNICVYYS